MKTVSENALVVIFTTVKSLGIFSNGNCLQEDSVSIHFAGNKRLELTLRTRKLYKGLIDRGLEQTNMGLGGIFVTF